MDKMDEQCCAQCGGQKLQVACKIWYEYDCETDCIGDESDSNNFNHFIETWCANEKCSLGKGITTKRRFIEKKINERENRIDEILND